MAEENKTGKPIKIGLGKFTKIVILIIVIILAVYFIIDAIEYSAGVKNENVNNIIGNSITEINSKTSGDIMPEV